MTTLVLTFIMMAGLLLLLWGAVGFVQDKRFFSSAPKEIQEAAQPKPERFKGQHILGWCMLILALLLMAGAVLLGAWDGIRNDFAIGQFFLRFIIMFLGMKAFDIAFFDWFLLCHSNFFPHYYPEVKNIVGPHLFGYNKKAHLKEIIAYIAASGLLALICTALSR